MARQKQKKVTPNKGKRGCAETITDKHVDLVEKLARLGATDEQMFDCLGIGIRTFYRWQQRHPAFAEAIKRGKLEADARVASAVYSRALGYSHPDTDIRVVAGEIVKTEIIKHYPPDTMACMYWLNNRQRLNWKQRQDVEVGGKDGKPIEVKEVTDIDAARRIAFALAMAANDPKLTESQQGAA